MGMIYFFITSFYPLHVIRTSNSIKLNDIYPLMFL